MRRPPRRRRGRRRPRARRVPARQGQGCGTAALNAVPCACLLRLHAAGVVEPQRADGVDFEERRRAARVEAGRRPVRLELGAPYQATAHVAPSEGGLPSSKLPLFGARRLNVAIDLYCHTPRFTINQRLQVAKDCHEMNSRRVRFRRHCIFERRPRDGKHVIARACPCPRKCVARSDKIASEAPSGCKKSVFAKAAETGDHLPSTACLLVCCPFCLHIS